MKKILILSNHHMYTYNLRKEIIQKLIDGNYKVYLIFPYGERVEKLKEMGCEFIDLPLDRRGLNPINDLKLIWGYYRNIKNIEPDVVLSYTIKPNIYGGLICRILNIPFFPNITGLGTAVENNGILQKLLIFMCRLAYKDASCVFFQNEENKNFFIKNNINLKKHRLIPGSGVNTHYFSLLPYPPEGTIEFVFISRIMKEKGIEQYIDAAKYISKKYPNTRFHVCGFCEENYADTLKDLQARGILTYHGVVEDMKDIYKKIHCTIHPTYYPEGMSNVLLESAASGRPIITTNRSGCREIIDNGINGYIVEQQNSQDLIDKIEEFLKLSHKEKREMGLAGRLKVEKEFDRQIVVDAYIKEIKEIAER